jgi:hypothetical protein
MQHIRQVGGTKKLQGTSIKRETTKGLLTLAAFITLGTVWKTQGWTIHKGLSHANKLLFSTYHAAVTQLRSLA